MFKKALAIGIILLFLIAGFSTSQEIPGQNLVMQIEIIVGPYTQNVNNTSITVLWETNFPTTNNYVEYGENTSYGYIDYGDTSCYHHEISIAPPFISGYFKVVSDSIESNDFRFRIASHCYFTQYFKFVVIGDSRGTWDSWLNATEIANAVNAELPDFVIHGGDMVDDGKVQTQWEGWLALMKPLMQNSTLFGVLGNHERNCSRYYEIFALPHNEMWYCFDYGPCHFTILNNYEPWDVGTPQYEWLKNDLSSNSKPFKIICFHEPIYCSGGHEPRADVREAWEPLFKKYNVNLVLQAHCHYYQRTNPINGITYVVTGAAGAPLYTPSDAWFVNISKKTHHYCVLEVSLDAMKINFMAKDLQGNTFDDFIIHSSTTPYTPDIIGSTSGKPEIEYEYTFVTIDPDDDDVFYYIDWGDGTILDWIGPFFSGEEINLKHIWDAEDKYTIRAKARDDFGMESDWATLTVIMSKNKVLIDSLFLWFLERFPLLEKILCYIL